MSPAPNGRSNSARCGPGRSSSGAKRAKVPKINVKTSPCASQHSRPNTNMPENVNIE